MHLPTLFGMLGGLLVLAYAANRLFQWTRVPDVVVLMAVGLLVGPLLHLINAAQFDQVARPVGTLALILILFGAGLELNIAEALGHFPGGLLLGVLAYGGTTLGIGLTLSKGLGMSLSSGLLVGAVLGCTSATIVLPVLEQWKVSQPVKVTLLVEASLGDVLGVVTVGLLLALRLTGGGLARVLVGGLLQEVGLALLIAAAAGYLWSRLLPMISAQAFWQVLTFAVVLLLYAATEAVHASGLLAVLGFGLALSNLPGAPERLRNPGREEAGGDVLPHVRLHDFHGELAFLVRTFFFVILGLVVRVDEFVAIWLVLPIVLAVILLMRWLAILGSRWVWRGITPQERKTILWVLPRGLITIVLALEISQIFPEMELLPDLAFAVILLTNLIVVFSGLWLRAAGPAPVAAVAPSSVPTTGDSGRISKPL
jgi:Na+:H+ antiporter